MKEFNVAGSNISLALFTEVSNSWELLDSIQAGTLEPEVALMNASLIPDVFPVLAAAYNALIAKSRDSLTTRTLHSELVYNYSGSKHITESLKRFGISDKTTYILAVRFGASSDEMKDVAKLIKGKEVDLGELETKADETQIQKMSCYGRHSMLPTDLYRVPSDSYEHLKHYKITSQELAISSLSDAITCRIAVRDAL